MYGVGRSLVALSTLSSLAFHSPEALFRPFHETMYRGVSDPGPALSLFSVSGDLSLARWLGILILVLVVSGWRPRITGILHWYVSFSFASSCFIAEGGDQIGAIVTLLLIPITLTDSRVSHWHAAPPDRRTATDEIKRLIASSAWTMIRLQAAVIYFHASIGKMNAPEWLNGTAMYYWVQHPLFGAPGPLRTLLLAAFTVPILVMAATWGVVAFELLLASALVMEKRHWPALLVAGLCFHLGIVVVHGLGSFFLTMAGALVLYLRPCDEPFPMTGLRVAEAWRVLTSGAGLLSRRGAGNEAAAT